MRKNFKMAAMIALSACMIAGTAFSACAAPVENETRTGNAVVVAHKTSSCKADPKEQSNPNAQIVVQFTDANGESRNYTICAECGEVNGMSGILTAVKDPVANFESPCVYTGTLNNGETVMTAVCLSANGAMTGIRANIWIPKETVEGYDLYLVNADGTETKVGITDKGSRVVLDVDMQDGASLIRMVPQTNG